MKKDTTIIVPVRVRGLLRKCVNNEGHRTKEV